MSKDKTLWIVLISILALIMISSVLTNFVLINRMPDTAYISTNKVFEEFGMKKELEKKFESIKEERKQNLDSLKAEVKYRFDNIKNQEAEYTEEARSNMDMLKKHYLKKEEQYKNNNRSLKQKYNKQIWERLNQYIEAYGRQNGYDYIYGVQGQGNIMYAQQAHNITQKVIKFVNQKYNDEL